MDTDKYDRIREELHRYPELSGKESETSKRLRNFFKDLPAAIIHTGIGGYGIIAEFRFQEPGPTLLFRADIDAVAIQEVPLRSYASRHPGISHQCGHDGHTTILLAFADLLQQFPFDRGRILLLFQPAEETGQGARQVLQDPFFQHNKIDRAFALHNLPGYPTSAVICRPGSFTCSVISCTIRITGKTAHAAEPEKAIPATPALLEILQLTESWNYNHPTSADYFRSTLVELHIGKEAYGVAAGSGLIRLTFRAATEHKLKERTRELERFVQHLTGSNSSLQYSMEWLEAFTANENNPEAVEIIKQAATRKHLSYIETDHPFAWGEDFGLFTQHFQGAMFGLGAGVNTPTLHTPEYDFPNEIILNGAHVFYDIASVYLKNYPN